MNDEKIIFEDCNIIFDDKEFEEADAETLMKCKRRLEETLEKLHR